MIYKTLQKVSNVCQLLDKSKYPASTTINGVTFTNNGDGSITLNGTATGLCQYRITNSYKKLIGENTNKCLLVGSISADSGTPYYLQLDFIEGNSWSRAALDFGKGTIFTNSDSSLQLLSIIVKSGVTVNNLTFKPQLFDLTEMYGAGNEPTSVEEFRSKFSNDLYDYSPNCFITSYKNCLTCKTKNLFDINSVTEVRHIRTGLLKPTSKWSIKNNSFITTLNNYNDGVTYILPTLSLEPGIYTFSAFCTSDHKYCWFGVYDFNKSKGFDEYYTTNKQLSKTFEITEKSDIGLIMQGYNKDFIGTFSNIQLELGNTATEYVPYGHLTSYKKSLICTTKNLLNPKMCDIYQEVAYGLNIEYIDNNQTVHIYGTSTVTTGSASFNVIKTSDNSIYNKGYKIKFFNLVGKNPPVFKDIYGLREIDTIGQIAIMIEITKGVYYDFSFKIMVSEQTATEYHPYGYL